MNSSSSISQNAKNRAIIRRPMTKSSNLRKSAPTRVVITRSNSRSAQTSGKSTSYLNRRSSLSICNQTYINDSALIDLRNNLYENPTFDSIDSNTLQKLQAHLREYTQDRALYEDYDNAEKATALNELVKLEISKRPSNYACPKKESNNQQNSFESASDANENNDSENNHDQNPDKELDSNTNAEPSTNPNANVNVDSSNNDEQKRLKEFEDKWKDKFEKFDQATNQKVNELEEKQSSQLEEFEKVWSTEKPQKYRKPSSKLLQLKKIERTLALSGQFDQARTIHAEAEQLAAKEQKELQSALIRDYRSAKENFISKQNKEKQKLLQSRHEARSSMEIQKNADYNKLLKRNIVVQEKLKEAQRGTTRERSGVIKPDYGISVSTLNQNKVKFNENIIPPLIAPNDPNFVEEDEKKMKEKRKKQREYHKKNAELSLLEYTVQPSPREEKNEDQNSSEGKKKEELNDILDPMFSLVSNNQDEENISNDNCQNDAKFDENTNINGDYKNNNIDNYVNNINNQKNDIINDDINNNNDNNIFVQAGTRDNESNNFDQQLENNYNQKTDLVNNVISNSNAADKDKNQSKEEVKPNEATNADNLDQIISIFGGSFSNVNTNDPNANNLQNN